MAVLEQLCDDQCNERSGESQPRLDDQSVGDRAATNPVRGQTSLVAPSTLEPRARLLDETVACFDLVERERVSVERQHVEQEEPTPKDDSSRFDLDGQRGVMTPARHVHERMKFEVHTPHRRHDSPHVVHVGVERRDELELDRTAHGTTMTAGLSPLQLDMPS